MNRNEFDKVTERSIGIAMRIYNTLSPCFVEKIYEKAMAYEFKKSKIKFAEKTEIRVE